MQEIPTAPSYYLFPVTLYLDDIYEVLKILQEFECKNILMIAQKTYNINHKTSTKNFKINDIEELKQLGRSVSRFEILAEEPSIRILFSPFFVKIRSENPGLPNRNLALNIREFLKKYNSPFSLVVASFFPVWFLLAIFPNFLPSAMNVLGKDLLVNFFLIEGILHLLWFGYRISLNVIYTKKREQEYFRGLFERNKDQLILQGFSHLVVFILGLLSAYLLGFLTR